MTETHETRRLLAGRRVRVTTPDGELFGRVSGAPADGRLFLRQVERPFAEHVLAASSVVAVEPAPLLCPVGDHETETLSRRGRCAQHERDAALTEAASVYEACDDCGGPAAFRSPLDRKDVFRCVSCHAEAGTLSGLGAEARVLEDASAVRSAPCRSADEDDPAHDWHRVRGSHYRCKTCQVSRHTKPRSA